MFYFHLAPSQYRKILFVLRDVHARKPESLAEYYMRTYSHLIPGGVSIMEFDGGSGLVKTVGTTCKFPLSTNNLLGRFALLRDGLRRKELFLRA